MANNEGLCRKARQDTDLINGANSGLHRKLGEDALRG